jgi:hypothetical protein
MNRLNTGMLDENPKWYNNYDSIWEFYNEPSYHAHNEWNILNSIIKYTNYKIIDTDRLEPLQEIVRSNQNNIYIFWNSISSDSDKEWYLSQNIEWLRDLYRKKNFILFCAGTNIRDWIDWILKNKIYQEDIDTDDKHWVYGLPSTANWKYNSTDRHILVTIWTNANWDIDQTNMIYESSKFPVWFHNKVLFAGRMFPYFSASSWRIEADGGTYTTSYPNYLNVAIADLCFQMKADVADVDELLEMIRSTSLTDHIRFNWEDQPLQLMNPAWFFKTYLMPNTLPNNLKSEQVVQLNKWYYRWVIFDIPWAEVKINWQWIPYNESNKSLIKSQNPMVLEWRINWDLCKKMWYKWKSVSWKIIAVDDGWNWLNIDKEFSISVQ